MNVEGQTPRRIRALNRRREKLLAELEQVEAMLCELGAPAEDKEFVVVSIDRNMTQELGYDGYAVSDEVMALVAGACASEGVNAQVWDHLEEACRQYRLPLCGGADRALRDEEFIWYRFTPDGQRSALSYILTLEEAARDLSNAPLKTEYTEGAWLTPQEVIEMEGGLYDWVQVYNGDPPRRGGEHRMTRSQARAACEDGWRYETRIDGVWLTPDQVPDR